MTKKVEIITTEVLNILEINNHATQRNRTKRINRY